VANGTCDTSELIVSGQALLQSTQQAENKRCIVLVISHIKEKKLSLDTQLIKYARKYFDY
jgi:hypothetical protein